MALSEEKDESPDDSAAPEAPLLEDFRPDVSGPRIAPMEAAAPRNL